MGKLRTENSRKCLCILREFIDDAISAGNQKEIANLALKQLEKITAGTGTTENSGPDCNYRPRAG
jgi:hypothetical protein